MPAGGPHSYLHGTGIEVLANSDYWNYPSSDAVDLNPVSVGVNPNVDNPSQLAASGEERVDDSDQPDELDVAPMPPVRASSRRSSVRDRCWSKSKHWSARPPMERRDGLRTTWISNAWR